MCANEGSHGVQFCSNSDRSLKTILLTSSVCLMYRELNILEKAEYRCAFERTLHGRLAMVVYNSVQMAVRVQEQRTLDQSTGRCDEHTNETPSETLLLRMLQTIYKRMGYDLLRLPSGGDGAWALTYPPGGQDSEGSLCALEDVQP